MGQVQQNIIMDLIIMDIGKIINIIFMDYIYYIMEKLIKENLGLDNLMDKELIIFKMEQNMKVNFLKE